jgi:hypothetical protein
LQKTFTKKLAIETKSRFEKLKREKTFFKHILYKFEFCLTNPKLNGKHTTLSSKNSSPTIQYWFRSNQSEFLIDFYQVGPQILLILKN